MDIRTIDLSQISREGLRGTSSIPSSAPLTACSGSFDYQRELTKDLVATLGYVGNRGLKLLTLHWLNDIDITTGRRPVTNISRISYQEHSGMSIYHGLQTSLKKRFSRGITFNAHYTYGKGMQLGGVDGMTASTVNPVQDHSNIRASRSRFISGYHAHTSWPIIVGILPSISGSGRLRASCAQIAGGWQIFGIWSMRSGNASSDHLRTG